MQIHRKKNQEGRHKTNRAEGRKESGEGIQKRFLVISTILLFFWSKSLKKTKILLFQTEKWQNKKKIHNILPLVKISKPKPIKEFIK